MKRNHDTVKEYVRGLNEEELKFLYARYAQRLGGDIAEATEYLQKNPEIDRWLAGAGSSGDFFARLDHIDALVQGEFKRRAQNDPKEKAGASR
jgi:hypothetical protein